ncbi:MAG: hypothetical protein EOP00_33145, partial [Pedobacter sp.]
MLQLILMKVFTKILKYFFLITIIVFGGLLIQQPYLVRVLWYRQPDAETYKAFPQEIVYKSDSIFHFFRTNKMRTDLDTLKVIDGKKQFLPFAEYFKRGKLN